MPVLIRRVTSQLRGEFVAYALAHGAEHDDSWANAEDLRGFDPAVEPAALASDGEGTVVGAASLMVRGYVDQGLARFRILHGLAPDPALYGGLLAATVEGLDGRVDKVFLFLPAAAGPVEEVLAGLGFGVERYSFVLARPAQSPTPIPPLLPPGVGIRAVDPARDAQAWCVVMNAAFAGQPGRFDVTADMLAQIVSGAGHVDGALQMAWNGEEPVGLVRISADPDTAGAADVEQVAVVPRWQGRGLGRALLRTGLLIAFAHGLREINLSTHATNRRALALYTGEGFEIESEWVCWSAQADGLGVSASPSSTVG